MPQCTLPSSTCMCTGSSENVKKNIFTHPQLQTSEWHRTAAPTHRRGAHHRPKGPTINPNKLTALHPTCTLCFHTHHRSVAAGSHARRQNKRSSKFELFTRHNQPKTPPLQARYTRLTRTRASSFTTCTLLYVHQIASQPSQHAYLSVDSGSNAEPTLSKTNFAALHGIFLRASRSTTM